MVIFSTSLPCERSLTHGTEKTHDPPLRLHDLAPDDPGESSSDPRVRTPARLAQILRGSDAGQPSADFSLLSLGERLRGRALFRPTALCCDFSGSVDPPSGFIFGFEFVIFALILGILLQVLEVDDLLGRVVPGERDRRILTCRTRRALAA